MTPINDPKLTEIVRRLRDRFKPKSVYLFGSRARGDYRPDSDYDLLLVVDKADVGRLDRMTQAREVLSGLDVSADVFVYTVNEFNEWKDQFSSIPETVLREGQELKVG